MIKEILDAGAQVSLFTRPRRFGKTLAISMLQTFFEDERDAQGNRMDNGHYFDGKKIADCGEAYFAEQGKYPVISLTLKEAGQTDYTLAYAKLKDIIAYEYHRHSYVLQGKALSKREHYEYQAILNKEASESDARWH